jgi:hypothetical protein
MKTLTPGLIVLLLALAGCSEGNLAGMEETSLDESALSSAGKSEVRMVPVKGTWYYVVDPDGTPVPCYIPGNPTPVTTIRSNRLLATGYVSHLGKTTSVVTVEACVVTAGGYLLATGTTTDMGANGDGTCATWVGHFYPDGRIDFPTILFTGGTGRFEGVEGWASGAGSQTPEGGTYWIDEGMISSVGSTE